MSDPRLTGLSLMGLAIVCFLGTTSQMLPSVVFFPALVIFVIGGTILCAIASLYVHRYLEQPLLRLFRFPLVKSGRELQS